MDIGLNQSLCHNGMGIFLLSVPELRRADWRRIWQKIERKDSGRLRKAQDKALEHLGYILETVPTPDFVEIVAHVKNKSD